MMMIDGVDGDGEDRGSGGVDGEAVDGANGDDTGDDANGAVGDDDAVSGVRREGEVVSAKALMVRVSAETVVKL